MKFWFLSDSTRKLPGGGVRFSANGFSLKEVDHLAKLIKKGVGVNTTHQQEGDSHFLVIAKEFIPTLMEYLDQSPLADVETRELEAPKTEEVAPKDPNEKCKNGVCLI
jgi:hypothetical protein